MAKTHFLFCRDSQRYFRTHRGVHQFMPDAPTKAEADLYEHQDALTIATAYYGVHWVAKCDVIPATLAEHMQWRGRRAGSVTSPKKTKAARRAWKRGARICRACGGRMGSRTPATQPTHDVCP